MYIVIPILAISLLALGTYLLLNVIGIDIRVIFSRNK
jgi:hypothetical protein